MPPLEPLQFPPLVLGEFISEADLSTHLDVKPDTLRVWRERHQLPSLKLGGRRMYRFESVVVWAREREQVER